MGKAVGYIKNVFWFVVFGAILLAVLSLFNYDIVAVFVWAWDKIVNWTVRLAGYFVSLPIFRAFFKA